MLEKIPKELLEAARMAPRQKFNILGPYLLELSRQGVPATALVAALRDEASITTSAPALRRALKRIEESNKGDEKNEINKNKAEADKNKPKTFEALSKAFNEKFDNKKKEK